MHCFKLLIISIRIYSFTGIRYSHATLIRFIFSNPQLKILHLCVQHVLKHALYFTHI